MSTQKKSTRSTKSTRPCTRKSCIVPKLLAQSFIVQTTKSPSFKKFPDVIQTVQYRVSNTTLWYLKKEPLRVFVVMNYIIESAAHQVIATVTIIIADFVSKSIAATAMVSRTML